MPDIVRGSGLSVGAIYRYFKSEDGIVRAICAQGTQALPQELTSQAIPAFLSQMQALSRSYGHARLVAPVNAEAALSKDLAALLRGQLEELQNRIAELVPDQDTESASRLAGAFVALCQGYSQQMAVGVLVDIDAAASVLPRVVRC
jgi:AcrR family transcriptional regulator